MTSMGKSKRQKQIHIDEEQSILASVSDIMAALLMIFILLAATALLRLREEYQEKADMSDTYHQQSIEYQRLSEQYKDISETYKKMVAAYHQLQEDLYQDMMDEFSDDLPIWQAILDKDTLSMRFQEPEVLFSQGKSHVSERFRTIIVDFFPRYINVLTQEKYKNHIEEIRIEGHTSSEWENETETEIAYFMNMELSQDRTRNVLRCCLDSMSSGAVRDWTKGFLTANGLSSSKLIYTDGEENKSLSRRVEFRIRTDAEKRISEILNLSHSLSLDLHNN